MKKNNILLIVIDQLRFDALGFMGNEIVKTPHIDTLAGEGIIFNKAYTACSSCIPSRAAIFTGLAPKNHKRIGYMDGVAWEYENTLPKELTKQGYYTQCVGKMHVSPLRNSLGFHNVELHDGYLHYYRREITPSYENQKIADDYYYWLKNELGIDVDVSDTGIDCNSWVSRPWIYDEKYHPTNWVSSRSIDFLRRRDRDKPFFLMASYVRPHPPFDAPAYYFDLYKNKDLPKSPIGDWVDEDIIKNMPKDVISSIAPNDDELIKQAKIGYYACITHLDHQIGRLIQELKERHLYDNTLIIFTSDHGELLMDHNLFRKSLPYEGATHIPFFISGGYNALKCERNSACDSLIELRDILPTIVDYAGGDIPKNIDGKSLLPLLEKPSEDIRDYLHGEHSYGDKSNHFIVTKKDKYVWFYKTGEEQYFNMEDDPMEEKNIIKDIKYKERIEQLKKYLIEELKDREENFTDGKTLNTIKQEKYILS